METVGSLYARLPNSVLMEKRFLPHVYINAHSYKGVFVMCRTIRCEPDGCVIMISLSCIYV